MKQKDFKSEFFFFQFKNLNLQSWNKTAKSHRIIILFEKNSTHEQKKMIKISRVNSEKMVSEVQVPENGGWCLLMGQQLI